MSLVVHELLLNPVKIINEIKDKAINSQKFKTLCEQMGF